MTGSSSTDKGTSSLPKGTSSLPFLKVGHFLKTLSGFKDFAIRLNRSVEHLAQEPNLHPNHRKIWQVTEVGYKLVIYVQ